MEVAGDVENALDADMFNFLNEEFSKLFFIRLTIADDFDLDMQQILDTPEHSIVINMDTSPSRVYDVNDPGDLLLTPREALCLQSSEDVGAATIIGEPPAVSAASLECDSSEVEVPPVVSFQEVPLVAPPSPPTPLYHIQTRTPIIRSNLPIHPKAIQNRTSPPATEHVTLTTTHFRQMPFGAKRHCLSTIPHRTIAFQRPNVLHVPIKSVDAVRKTMPTSTNPIKLESDWASGSLSSASDTLHLSSNTVANASGNLTDVRAVMSRQSLFPPSVPSGTDVAPYTTNSAHTQSFGVTRPSTLALVPLFSDGTRVQSNHHHQQQQHHPVQPFGADLITIDELSLPMHALREVSEETCDKIIKKQERMIKNRQAACLSRLRKKEMRLLQLKEENAHLRQENHEWRHRYDHLEKCLEDVRSELSSLSPSYSSRILVPPVTSSQISPASSSSFSPSADSCTSPSTSDTSTSLDPLPLTSLATTTDRLARLPTILPKNESRPPSALSDYTHLPTFTLSRGSVGPHKQSAERSVMQKNNSLPRVLSVSRGGVPLATTGARGPSESFTLGFLPQTAAKASATSAFPAAYSLPRGGRKKVTTSLFALTCLLALNTFVFPLFNQPPANVRSLSSDKNVGLPSGGFGSVFPERVLGPGVRTLLSMPADSLTEARPAMVDSDRISPVTINSTNCTEARSPEPEVPGPSLNSSAPGFPSSVDVKKSQQVLVLLHGPGSKEDNLSPHNLSTREIVPRLTRVLRRRQRLRDRLILQDRTFQVVSGKPDEAAKYYRISQLEVQIASVKQHRISYV
ncbi:unnamed protein product [Schistocephalus solidus]|uniref:BZIP domain-containing protein n=1 Tax=Schistocephalus solidus TaxID=70667 RepID=A0A183SEE9_SCHSO|nr:unnamed protein product [Schistocephalus solidus]